MQSSFFLNFFDDYAIVSRSLSKRMKQLKFLAKLTIITMLLVMLFGCTAKQNASVAATTLPVWQFTTILCEGTPVTAKRLVTEEVSCLHDYTLTVRQMKAIESADVVILSGAGLEEFLDDALTGAKTTIDASTGIELLEGGCHHHDHEQAHHEEEHHDHEMDSHIWLSPVCAMEMSRNICAGLCEAYPEYAPVFQENLETLLRKLQTLDDYARDSLSSLPGHEIITFHDGFGYLCHEYGIEILEAIEEESGSEPSAQELIHLIELVQEHQVGAIFVEANGSGSAASIIAAETGAKLYTLDMAMAGDDYFAAMYRNIDTLKEALG